MEEEDRRQVWELYGWFSGLMWLGSVFGAVAWGAWMQVLVANFTPGLTPAQKESSNAQAQYWAAAFFVTFAIEFLCLSVAKLLVLDCMADFELAKGGGMRRLLGVGGRVVMAVVVVGNSAGLCGNVAAAVYSKEAGDLYMAASAAYTANHTESGVKFANLALQKSSVASNEVASVQQFFEVVVLLITILAFAVVGIACARRVSSALRNMNDAQRDGAGGRQLRRHIVCQILYMYAHMCPGA
jgi:hypothetical protein